MKFFRTFSVWLMRISIVAMMALQLAVPFEAKAQLGGPVEVTQVLDNWYDRYNKGLDKMNKSIDHNLYVVALTGLMNSAQVISQRFAHDAAMRILTNDAGKYPMFWEDNFGDYLANTMKDAGEIWLDTFNQGVLGPLGLDICQPIDPLSFTLSIGLPQADQLKAKCSFKAIAQNFNNVKSAFNTTEENFKNFKPIFDPTMNDLGASFTAKNRFLSNLLDKKEQALYKRTEGAGIKPVTDPVTGKIKTPSAVIKDTLRETNPYVVVNGQLERNNAAWFANAFAVGAKQLAMVTASTFASTLIVGAINKIFNGIQASDIAVDSANLTNPEAVINSNVANARIVFSDLLTPNLYSTDQEDYVVEMSACPSVRGMWNCVMDEALATGLRAGGENGAVTVGHAAHVGGSEVQNPEYLHKDWQLIPASDQKENSDPSCYTRAYCASNIVKMRYARILPAGWEFAANSPYNQKQSGSYVTLGEVIRNFDNCNENGEIDQKHPWCHLIDPNWVLTAPSFQCRVKGYGETLLTGTASRLEECSEAVSCLRRNEQGKCVGGYGYCLAEKPVWRFNGDACIDRYASCRTYTDRNNQVVSYVRNTVDYGACSAENVGCIWYATERDTKDDTGATWVGAMKSDTGPRVYFDATAQACSASGEGCTKLLAVEAGKSALNLVPNSSFERVIDGKDPLKPMNWYDKNIGKPIDQKWKVDATSIVDGNYSLNLPSLNAGETGVVLDSDVIQIAPVRNYTFTFYARLQEGLKMGTVGVLLDMYKADKNGNPTTFVTSDKKYYRSIGCHVPVNESKYAVGYSGPLDAPADGSSWHRYECSFVSSEDAGAARVRVAGTGVQVDSIQLEESDRSTEYVDGVVNTLPVEYLKVAPDEFACKGTKDDNKFCSNFARVCTQAEAGCQGYKDVENASAPEIPANLTGRDSCDMSSQNLAPDTCVGYAEYHKLGSAFDLGKNADDRLNDPQDDTVSYFIPKFSEACLVQDVGCEEFTNVEGAAQGGENKAYYNYIRACQKPGPESETYFTWEGSDTAGYQLHTWSLIHGTDPNVKSQPPKVVQKVGPDGVLKDPADCNEKSWFAGVDQDCRQFFNANGTAFYAYLSQTIVSSADCRDLRKNNSDQADCSKTGGAFNVSTNECLYQVLPSESRTCSNARAAGCRAYIGTLARNANTVLSIDFKQKDAGQDALFTNKPQLSNESILVGDQSLKIAGAGKLETATTFTSLPNFLYSVSFWAKGVDPNAPATSLVVDNKAVATFKIQPDWHRYEFGPFAVSSTIDTKTGVATSTIAWVGLPNPTFLDTIEVQRLNDVVFAVKNKWVVPNVCDMTREGIPQPQAMLGCRTYTDRDGKKVYVRGFGNLCREEAIGCKAFVDTRNSADPYGQTFALKGTNAGNTGTSSEAKFHQDLFIGDTTTTRGADRYVYLIDDPSKRCEEKDMSCRAFGKPKFAQDLMGMDASSTPPYETVYLIDDVSKYVDDKGEPNMLCRKDELFCDEFRSGKTVAYFRNPGNHSCEWQENLTLKMDLAHGIKADGKYSGWFRTGTTIPCYAGNGKNEDALISAGNTFINQNAGDNGYAGWTSLCPIEQSECTEFRDPNDHSDALHPSGKPYYMIKNQHLDLTSCAGKADPLNGCVLFNDLSDPRAKYNVRATYAYLHEKGDVPDAPVDCTKDPDNAYCGRCVVKGVEDGAVKGVKEYFSKVWPEENSGLTSDGLTFEQALEKIRQTCLTSSNATAQKLSCALTVSAGMLRKAYDASQIGPCRQDSECTFKSDNLTIYGTCQKGTIKNDSNAIMKVKLDRDCSEWLGCSSSERAFDPAQQKYVDVCTNVGVCDASKPGSDTAFCGHYLNRKIDPVLREGVLFDEAVYSRRDVGFGKLDYSGYAIPGQFQAADVQNRQVGKELFVKTPSLANKFVTDYRLVAAVPGLSGLVQFLPLKADGLHPDLYLCKSKQNGRYGYYVYIRDPKNPNDPTGDKNRETCYFAIDSVALQGANANPDQIVDPRNMQQLADILSQSADAKMDVALMSALPGAECKANPEEESPFPAGYVKKWDLLKDPPVAKVKPGGYEMANFCEYGEDCVCSYRKVKYGTDVAYYSALGKAPASGICKGGDRDGQSCVPSKREKVSGQGGTNATPDGDLQCPNGTCQELSDVVLVRGQFGQCLERDMTRIVGNDPTRHPCLVWNPNPITTGVYDPYHYTPTAGYVPPVNAGEYYCTSFAKAPIQGTWTAESHTLWNDSRYRWHDGDNTFFELPGKLSKFNYDRSYIAGRCAATADTCGNGETDCNCHDGVSNIEAPAMDYKMVVNTALGAYNAAEDKCDHGDDDMKAACAHVQGYLKAMTDSQQGKAVASLDRILVHWSEKFRFQNVGQNIDGSTNDYPIDNGGSFQSRWCAENATFEDKDSPREDGVPGIWPTDNGNEDFAAGRWIQTGRGEDKTYMEYFFPVKPRGVVKWLHPGIAESAITEQTVKEAVSDASFAQFVFGPKSVDEHLAACAMPYWYTDEQNFKDPHDTQSVKEASQRIVNAFAKEFDGVLDRSKEGYVKDKDGKYIQIPCSGLNNENANFDVLSKNPPKCYMKYWETVYRLEGSRMFQWLQEDQDRSLYERHNDYYNQPADCAKSGFAIRAMFEDAGPDNQKTPTELGDKPLQGPFRFIGFWISACTANGAGDSYMYLTLKVKHADICRQLVQVVAPYSRESVAFADRVWNQGNFVVPQVGYTYSTDYPPFGSALVSGMPGVEPMFQTNGPNDVISKLKPPTFLGSGRTYYTNAIGSPRSDHWAQLSNLFARIYRVYDYYEDPTSVNDKVCMGGQFFGKLCKADQDCGGTPGVCRADLATADQLNTTHRCNGLSGVNAGLSCGDKGGTIPSLDPTCHNAPMHTSGVGAGVTVKPMYTNCALRAGWSPDPVDPGKVRDSKNISYSIKKAYVDFNAFGCDDKSVLPNAGCLPDGGKTSGPSKYCPMKIVADSNLGDQERANLGLKKKTVEQIEKEYENHRGTSFCIPDDGGSMGIMSGHCVGYSHARCDAQNPHGALGDNACVFTVSQWWGTYDDGKPTKPEILNDIAGGTFSVSVKTQPSPYLLCDADAPLMTENDNFDMCVAAYWLQKQIDGDAKNQDEINFGRTAYEVSPYLGGAGKDVFPILQSAYFSTNSGSFYHQMHSLPISLGTISEFDKNGGYAAILIDKCDPNDMSRLCRYTFAPFASATWPSYYSRMSRLATVSPELLQRWPSPHNAVKPPAYAFFDGAVDYDTPAAQEANKAALANATALVLPGLCEGAVGSKVDNGTKIQQDFGRDPGTYYLYKDQDNALLVGMCQGGKNDGQMCTGSLKSGQCPAEADPEAVCKDIASESAPPDGKCYQSVGIKGSVDPDLDNNACTHSAGYVPRSSLCGDPTNTDKCLVGYDLSSGASQQSLDPKSSQLPTDVTMGFHTPTHLGLFSGSPSDYKYIAYYSPRPPMIAAPDMSHTCSGPGTCPVSTVGTFSVENQTNGQVNFSGGQGQINLRFYGWAGLEQAPLKALYVDWGDGNRVTIENARMKNKKPFCDTARECRDVPGLTCSTDADCPPGAGGCIEKGTCQQDPSRFCSSNAECDTPAHKGDICKFRTFFGNSSEACETNFFDFTHVYSCTKQAMTTECRDNNKKDIPRCSQNPDIICAGDSDCGPGSKCIQTGMAPAGGCFDSVAMTCRYTPRVLLKDNWNWCSGECRAGGKDKPIDLGSAVVKHEFGGCWDGTEVNMNRDVSKPLMSEADSKYPLNECSTSFERLSENGPDGKPAHSQLRPWVTFQGAVNIGIVQ